jgi:hypothetical protein
MDKDGKPGICILWWKVLINCCFAVSIGEQQDVADFNDIFLKAVAKGFEIVGKSETLSKSCIYWNAGSQPGTSDPDIIKRFVMNVRVKMWRVTMND